MSDRWIIIPRWDEFQHYKNREPKWIKNYTRLLHDDNYLSLTVAQRGILHGLWLLYARSGGIVSEELGRRELVRCESDARYWKRHLEALNHAGWIEFLLAPRYQNASPEKEVVQKNPRAVMNPRYDAKSKSNGQGQLSHISTALTELLPSVVNQ